MLYCRNVIEEQEKMSVYLTGLCALVEIFVKSLSLCGLTLPSEDNFTDFFFRVGVVRSALCSGKFPWHLTGPLLEGLGWLPLPLGQLFLSQCPWCQGGEGGNSLPRVG